MPGKPDGNPSAGRNADVAMAPAVEVVSYAAPAASSSGEGMT